ncbi:hypothetical protein [Chitinophaga sp. CF118]|uniref:hypothetical protein n=1 Tax=Chitinophaga sp. CF118 TaxID=1884367 RepID=UPI001160472F|nr:hypothetical protein [Chitinophaga sp. CF118]
MELAFPIESFLQIKEDVISNRENLEKEKSVWLSVRKLATEEDLNLLDEQFKTEFEKLGSLFLNPPSTELQNVLVSLQVLVQKGASAKRLGNDELGNYNLAMAIKNIPIITSKASLEIACEIIRITIIAEADLNSQKAYAGNGGSNSIEWICLYLAAGVGNESYIHNMDHYEYCYKIFCWIIESEILKNTSIYKFNPFSIFIINLRNSPEALDLQEKIILRMICLGISPFPHEEIYQSLSFFNRIAPVNLKWIGILFPYENDYIKPYLKAMKMSINEEIVTGLINSCTSSNTGRKYFKVFFSLHAHWLLEFIIESVPETIFSLVRRNEKDLLVPFLKNFQPAMRNLRDKKGNTLLHQAMLCRGLIENTIQLLLQAKFSFHVINKDGITPLELALKNNRTDLTRLLK